MELDTGDIDALVTWSLIRAAHRAERRLTRLLADQGLTPVQFGVLAYLATGESFTQAQLARAVLVRPQSLSGVLAGLEERGLVARGGVRMKGRRNPLELTNAGHQRLSEAWPVVDLVNTARSLNATDAEAEELNRMLLAMLRRPDTDTDPGADGS